MREVKYTSIKVFTYKKAYRIKSDIDSIVNQNMYTEDSAARDAMQKYKLVNNLGERMTLCPKYRSIVPIIFIDRQKDFLFLTYDFTSLGIFTVPVFIMMIISFFRTDGESLISSSKLIFFLIIVCFWSNAIHTAKCIDRFFLMHEFPMK